MFYDRFKELCSQKGISCNKAATDMGLSNSTPTKWKKTGATPDGITLAKISTYFGVPVNELLTNVSTGAVEFTTSVGNLQDYFQNRNKEKVAIDVVDDDLQEYLDELRSRPEKRMLFSVTKNATKSQIEAIVKMIEEMQDKP